MADWIALVFTVAPSPTAPRSLMTYRVFGAAVLNGAEASRRRTIPGAKRRDMILGERKGPEGACALLSHEPHRAK